MYRGHTAPVTALALSHYTAVAPLLLYTSSWDKTILCFDAYTRSLLRKFTNGHSDFIKCLLFLPPRSPTNHSPGLLLSGSSDSTITIWNPLTTEKLSSLPGHIRGVLSLALDPTPPESSQTPYVVLSGGSEREIRTWCIPAEGTSAHEDVEKPPLISHATSVYKLRFSTPDDLWTASADTTAQRINIRHPERPSDEILQHPDFVNDVIVAGGVGEGDGEGMWVVTACRDENVRLWNRATGKLVHIFDGHFDEVTSLTTVGPGGWVVVSVSIDGTVRRWGVRPDEVQIAIEEAKKRGDRWEEQEDEELRKESALTEEEERELADLMEDSD